MGEKGGLFILEALFFKRIFLAFLFYERGKGGLNASVAHAPLIDFCLPCAPSTPPTTLFKVCGIDLMDFFAEKSAGVRDF